MQPASQIAIVRAKGSVGFRDREDAIAAVADLNARGVPATLYVPPECPILSFVVIRG